MSRIISLYKTKIGDNQVERRFLEKLRPDYPGLQSVRIEDVLRLEYENGVEPDFDKLKRLFCYPGAEEITMKSVLGHEAEAVEISYKRAWTDPELSSVFHAASALGVSVGLKWARLATRYEFTGVDRLTVEDIAARFLYNQTSQTVIKLDEFQDSLRPRGQHEPLEHFDLAQMSLKGLTVLSESRRLFLAANQLKVLRRFFQLQNRPARDAEIEMMAALWGDHCQHTTWKALGLLQVLQEATRQINHPLVISAYEDNSGVMKFYGGWAICAKGETHISPTLVEPYGGVMTKHGGVIRDVIGTGPGAKPIIGTTIMATRNPRLAWWQKVHQGTLPPATTVREAIRGTKDYTNPMGIPMALSQYLAHPRNVKNFALGHSVGILPAKKAKKGVPHAGDFVVLIGGLTGNDGLHGSTVSSSAATAKTMETDAAHVQIGAPIEERVFMEAIPKLRNAGCLRFLTDNGAAGLTCSLGESGSFVKQGKTFRSGVWANLAWVPLKCAGMPAWAILLSESQERMTLAVIPEKLELTLEILADHGCLATVIGVYTATERCQAVYDPTLNKEAWLKKPEAVILGKVAVDLPYSFIDQKCPLPKFSLKEPAKPKPFKMMEPKTESRWVELMQRLLGHYNICDQSWAAHQYDQTVQGGTVISYLSGKNENMPEEIFAQTPVLGKPWTVGIANAVNQLYGAIDPAALGKLIYAQAVAKLVAAGFSPTDITTVCNVYTAPAENPEHAWRLSKLVKDGYAAASVILGVPVISGKDSSSGRFTTDKGKQIDAPLTFNALALGRMPNWRRLIPKAFARSGDLIVLYAPGLKKIGLGGSLLNDLAGELGDDLPEVDLDELRAGWYDYHFMLKQLSWSKSVHSRAVVAEGGLIRRLFEMSLGSGLGCEVHFNIDNHLTGKPLELLCGELNAAIVFADSSFGWCKHLKVKDCYIIGAVLDEPVIAVYDQDKRLFGCSTEVLAEQWKRTFKETLNEA